MIGKEEIALSNIQSSTGDRRRRTKGKESGDCEDTQRAEKEANHGEMPVAVSWAESYYYY